MALFGGVQIPGHPDPKNIEKLDLLPIAQVMRMMHVGIGIDREWMWDLGGRLETRKVELKEMIAGYLPPEKLEEFVNDSGEEIEFNVDSAEQIAGLLYKQLGIGRGRSLKTTKSGKRISTGKKQLETLKRDHPVIALILEYRECSKLKNTYTDALPQQARLHRASVSGCQLCGLRHWEDHYRIHGEITYTRAVTGRFQMKKPNLFNIPARTKMGREVRKGFRASKGKRLMSRDLAQIELRLLADRAREENMIRIFLAGGDLHTDSAMRAFKLSKEVVESAEGKMLYRAPCKNVNFAIVYGLQVLGLYDLMAVSFATAGLEMPDWLTMDWCEGFIETWFELYPQAKAWLDLQAERARRYGIVWDMFGRVRRIPEVESVHSRVRAAGIRQAGNMPIQGGNAGILKIAMAKTERMFSKLRADGVGVEALVPVYDELICEVDEEVAEEVGEMIGGEMQSAMDDEKTGRCQLMVPILSDGKVGERWEK